MRIGIDSTTSADLIGAFDSTFDSNPTRCDPFHAPIRHVDIITVKPKNADAVAAPQETRRSPTITAQGWSPGTGVPWGI